MCAGIELFGELLLNRKELEVTNEERVRAMKAEELRETFSVYAQSLGADEFEEHDRLVYEALSAELLSRLSRVEELQQQVAATRTELKKYLNMADEETLVGGIRNLAQAYFSYKDAVEAAEAEAEKAKGERDRLRKSLQDAKSQVISAAAYVVRRSLLPDLENCRTIRHARVEVDSFDSKHISFADRLKDIDKTLSAALTPEPAQSTRDNKTTEYLRLAWYLHRRDEHNQFFFRCEHDACSRAVDICGVTTTDKMPEPNYGMLPAQSTPARETEEEK